MKKRKTKQYFSKEDEPESDPLRIREFDVVFKFSQFFEFLFYHFVFFFLLGPLSFIVLFPTAGKMLTRNMGFFGVNVMFFNQTIQWALLYTSVVLFFVFDHGTITLTEVMMIATAVFLRICTIASKYGSTHPLRIKLLKSKYLTYEELTQDYMLIQWRDQTDEVIEQELLAAIKRHDIDTALFFFNFLAEIDEETKTKLSGFKNKVAEKAKNLISTEFMGLDEKKKTGLIQNDPEKLEKIVSSQKSDDFNKSKSIDSEEGEFEKAHRRMMSDGPLNPVSPTSRRAMMMSSDSNPDDSSFRSPFANGDPLKKNQFHQGPRHHDSMNETNFQKDLMTLKSGEQNINPEGVMAMDAEKRKRNNLLNATLQNAKKFQMLSGVNLCREMVYDAKKKGIPNVLRVALMIGLFRALIPTFYRLGQFNYPFGVTKAQAYMSISYLICNMYFFAANLAFVLVGLSDLRKKFHVMTQLSNLISPRKVEEYESIKKYPTLNIFDPLSFKVWMNMRKIFMDFGRKYFLRINLNISIFLFFYAIIALILLLQYFDILPTFTESLLTFVFLFEIGLMFGLIIRSIFYGSYINDHFRVHQGIVQKNKAVMSDLLQLDDIYFPRKGVKTKFKPGNIMYKEAIRKIRALCDLAGFEEGSWACSMAIEDYLNKLVTLNNEALEELEFDSVNRPVQILGFVTNANLIRQILVGLLSLFFAIAQRAINKA